MNGSEQIRHFSVCKSSVLKCMSCEEDLRCKPKRLVERESLTSVTSLRSSSTSWMQRPAVCLGHVGEQAKSQVFSRRRRESGRLWKVFLHFGLGVFVRQRKRCHHTNKAVLEMWDEVVFVHLCKRFFFFHKKKFIAFHVTESETFPCKTSTDANKSCNLLWLPRPGWWARFLQIPQCWEAESSWATHLALQKNT